VIVAPGEALGTTVVSVNGHLRPDGPTVTVMRPWPGVTGIADVGAATMVGIEVVDTDVGA